MKIQFILFFCITVSVFLINDLTAQITTNDIDKTTDVHSMSYVHMPYIIKNPGSEYADSVRIFQGIHSLAVTPGGRLWATWYGGGTGEGPENYILLVTSGDNGKTWSDIQMENMGYIPSEKLQIG